MDIRDLLAGPPHSLEANTLQCVAYERPVHEVQPPLNPEFTARLPGDAPHPFAGNGTNPLPGVSVQEVARRLRAGELEPDLERKARTYIDQYQKFTGETLYASGNHEFIEPEVEPKPSKTLGWTIGGLVRADRFPNYESSYDYVQQFMAGRADTTMRDLVTTMPVITEENEAAVLESLWRVP